MDQITIRLEEDVLEEVEAEAEEEDETRSEYLRNVIASRNEHDDLQTEVERLRREKRQILEQREQNQQLAKYVEREKSIQERRQEWMEADLATRMRWRLFGRD
jgi:hypothetical protein